ncbi:1,4-alpha-glucan branching protein GlgB [Sinomonas sp. JGH33]|uniref:1,4-alpha-glucan branching enzyme GlgB n=1 Tax=Sinomonas terricola TaxID=3110330 RepID=A0ABU5TA74_9MICC|nr:1,4-alpha-glucan branching protein GlgB [Sinomonas sp. JGH33]MEA5456488.1 1,4-alpha-glucan branching protein GlgB [Sinomonas sp. JGH33]
MTDAAEATLTPPIAELLERWLPSQRWYPAKGRQAEFSRAGGVRLEDPDGHAEVEIYLVRVRAGRIEATLNVPLTYRAEPLPGAGHALIGRSEHSAFGARWIYDGVHDPAFLGALLALIGSGGPAKSGPAWGRTSGAGTLPAGQLSCTVLSSEQSNSSIIVRSDAGAAMVKVLRQPADGLNPEVELGAALARAGSGDVPATLGWVDGAWSHRGEGSARGQLAVVHEFLPGGQDLWQLSLDAAAEGEDFTAHARGLGAATARVHGALEASLGSAELDDDAAAEFVGGLASRLRAAWDEVRESVGLPDAALERLLETLAGQASGLRVQRVHGDLHLGQILHFPGHAERPYAILDFEGEPLRPVSERSRPDLPLRDVVGMLRSFDYAAGAAERTVPAARVPLGWVDDASGAFWEGYSDVLPQAGPLDGPLFAALWLDKALYEVAYEERNRPAWAEIPLRAVRRALGAYVPEGEPIQTAGPDGPAEGAAFRRPGEENDVTEHTEQQGAHAGGLADSAAPIPVPHDVLGRVAAGAFHAPHAVLGAHLAEDGSVTIRTVKHLATGAVVVTPEGRVPMRHEAHGVWVVTLPATSDGGVPDYRLEIEYGEGHVVEADDPYHYLPTVGELDLYLIGEGRHEELWKALGARVQRYHSVLGDVEGTAFTVWAPSAQAVQVKGDFNGWDGREHAMRSLGSSGVWEVFIPGVVAGACYKFGILTKHGHWVERADPMAFGTEVPPRTASRVVESRYAFKDQEWMAARAAKDPHNSPMSVYEVHLGSWRPGLSYRELATELVDYVTEMGFTHVEFMPVAEHPFGGSWGYQVTSYYAPSSRFGHPDDFRYLVDKLHQAGIGVIVDWVPAHFPKDEWALARFDGEALYEHADPQQGEHPDWGTYIFNFGRTEVRNFLVANALYWLEEFHVDGLRVDAVASMLYLDYSREEGQWRPNQFGGRENLEAISFLQEANATAYRRNAGIVMIAEESTAFPGVTKPTSMNGLGFGLKWNMGWMHDSLQYMEEDPVNRRWHHNKITFSIMYAFSENFLLPISHDEVVHGKGSMLRKMPGDRWKQLANLRAFYAFQWAHPGKQLIFMGCEFGQEGEWNQEHGLDWWLADTEPHKGLQRLIAELNTIYRRTPALFTQDNDPAGFEWIRGDDGDHNVLSFVRWSKDGAPLVCLANFAGHPHLDYAVGLPQAGAWREVLNTDETEFGGSGVTNGGLVMAEDREWDDKPAVATLTLPPLGVVYLEPVPQE